MSVVIRLKVPIEMHYAIIPMGTSKVNSSPLGVYRTEAKGCNSRISRLKDAEIRQLR